MILQALVDLYDHLSEKGELERPGWQPVNASYALQIDDSGELVRVVSLLVPTMRGKKEVFAPRKMNVPAPVKRTVGIASNFLCDNSSYMLGVDQKGKPERTRDCFAACKQLHEALLSNCEHPAAKAILRFFERWKPEETGACAALDEYREEITSGANLVFLYRGEFAQDIPELKQVWDAAYGEDVDAPEMRCLVTGERGPIAVLHPAIKGVRGGQPTGTSLVSFNARAFESYAHDEGQGANAPVSARAAFAYGAALNWLIGSEKNRVLLGDTTVVFWAEDAEPAYAQWFGIAFNGGDSGNLSQSDLTLAMKKLASGQPVDWNGVPLHPENRFYILGLAPNAARLSVRFFLADSFGAFARRMREHYERLEIVRPAYDSRETLTMWSLLNETVNQNARDKTPLPRLPGETMRAILSGAPYPETLYTQVQLRLRAGDALSRGKAAIVKAYLIKNTAGSARYQEYKEALSVELNESSTYAPYLLGRLFAVLEGLQQAANPGINATIRDRYFNSACATPAVAFPQLIKLAQAHLKKLPVQGRVYFDKQIESILVHITSDYPARLSLQDQGVFQLGYYHQTQKRYEKKEAN